MSDTDLHLHVPVPGELVAPTSGSALPTVAQSLGAAQLARGGRAALVVRAGLPHRAAPLDLVEVPLPDPVWLRPGQKAVDAVLGAAVDRRPFTDRLWAPIGRAIPAGHRGPVFLHNAPGAAATLRRERRLRPVVYLHNEVLRGWPPMRRRALVRRHPVICVSRFLADRLFPGPLAGGRVLTVLNGVDPRVFHPAAEEADPTVLFVGKISPHKGPDLLLAAVRLLHERGLRFRVRVVGGAELSAGGGLSPFEHTLRAQTADLGGMVEFLPFVDRDEIGQVFRSATIMVIPSNWDEPGALTLPEAMACGLACVVSRRGGLPELGGSAALYFDPRNVPELAAQLHRLLTDDDERRARAAAALARARELTWASRLTEITDWLDRWQPA